MGKIWVMLSILIGVGLYFGVSTSQKNEEATVKAVQEAVRAEINHTK